MSEIKKRGLFIFRRDLRINDNVGLYNLLKKCNDVHCIFILDPKQIDPNQNSFFSAPAMLFMIDSLIELQTTIPLKILYGDPYDVIYKLHTNYDIIGFNKDYSKYAIARDEKLATIPNVEMYDGDVCLNTPLSIKPYKVFTPYYNVASSIPVSAPVVVQSKKISDFKKKSVDLLKLRNTIVNMIHNLKMDITLIQKGGRSLALKSIKMFDCAKYQKNRDLLTYETSRLGPHLKFGTISVREVYHSCKSGMFRKQLYWRDFYLQIGYHFPKVYGNNFKNKIKWVNNMSHFKKWCLGQTGYDIVDACMTQLNKSGFMHNRGRMIVASFLTKILHIDWRWGEQYFATRLTDYDPANNNGGWQWSAGTGVDAQPYFRIFNPYTQAEKFDPSKEYQKKWLTRKPIPEIVDYEIERNRAFKLYN